MCVRNDIFPPEETVSRREQRERSDVAVAESLPNTGSNIIYRKSNCTHNYPSKNENFTSVAVGIFKTLSKTWR